MKTEIKWKTLGNRYRTLYVPDPVSRTQQEFSNECNINNIIAKYQKTGLITHVKQHQGNYGDYLNAVDYQSACNAVIAANDAFDSLPSNIRIRFNNNPVDFLAFVQNPNNRDEMVKLGLIETKPDVSKVVQNDLKEVQNSTELE